jgi:hypothetical protein
MNPHPIPIHFDPEDGSSQVPPIHWYPPSRLYSVTTQKTRILSLITVKTPIFTIIEGS